MSGYKKAFSAAKRILGSRGVAYKDGEMCMIGVHVRSKTGRTYWPYVGGNDWLDVVKRLERIR